MQPSTRIPFMLTAILVLIILAFAPTAAQPAGDPVRGVVAEVNEETVWLTSGASFVVDAQTRVSLVRPATVAELAPGMYAAITARPELDGALLASVVSAFPEEQRGLAEGQRPMDGGNLMTNATIDEAIVDAVASGELRVSFLSQTATVRVVPETQIEIRTLGSLADVVPGAEVTGFVQDGVARSIQVR